MFNLNKFSLFLPKNLGFYVHKNPNSLVNEVNNFVNFRKFNGFQKKDIYIITRNLEKRINFIYKFKFSNNVVFSNLKKNYFRTKIKYSMFINKFFNKKVDSKVSKINFKNYNKATLLCFNKNIFTKSFNFFLNCKVIISYNIFLYCYPVSLKMNKSIKSKINYNFFLKYLLFINDFLIFNNFKKNYSFFSNRYLISNLNLFNIFTKNNFKNNFKIYNNYYPIFFCNDTVYTSFFNNLKKNYNLNYIYLTNKLIISFFEKNFQKNIFLKINNNRLNKFKNIYFNNIINDYKNYKPVYLKNFSLLDFIEILWYSFFLKDLNMLSEYVTRLMETLNFKNHKKFINFFQNFISKYSGLFIDVLQIKGFFFDIRGKVGVTGSSKKRHIFFKFGSLSKSSKDFKINYNQNLVRTYSGVLGLTYILCY